MTIHRSGDDSWKKSSQSIASNMHRRNQDDAKANRNEEKSRNAKTLDMIKSQPSVSDTQKKGATEQTKGNEHVQNAKDTPQNMQKGRVETQGEGAKLPNNPEAQAQFQKVKEDAKNLHMLEGRKLGPDGRQVAIRDAVTTKQLNESQVAQRNMPQAKPDPQTAAKKVADGVAQKNAEALIKQAHKGKGAETPEAQKSPDGMPQVAPKLNAEAAPTLTQAAASAGVGQSAFEKKAERGADDAGSEKKTKTEKKGAESGRTGGAGRVYADGGRGLGALENGMGGGSSEGGAAGQEVGSAPAVDVPLAQGGGIPDLDASLHVFSDATDAEVAVMSKAQLLERLVVKTQRLKEIADFNFELTNGIVALSRRIGDGELAPELKRAMNQRDSVYGMMKG